MPSSGRAGDLERCQAPLRQRAGAAQGRFRTASGRPQRSRLSARYGEWEACGRRTVMQRLRALLPVFAFVSALASPLLPSIPGVAQQAIVLPQLSLECLAAIGVAYSACTHSALG